MNKCRLGIHDQGWTKCVIILFILGLLPIGSLAQKIKISGKVVDQSTGEALPNATLSVVEKSINILTDKEGYFAFTMSGVSLDSVTININYVGYRPASVRVANASTMLSICLQNGAVDLQEITVTSSKIELLKANEGISTYRIGADALNKLPAIGERDAFRAFQLLPGASASNQSSAGLYIRGGTPEQNLILFDGFPVYYVDHLHGFFSAFNPNTIKQIELSKGGYSALYGGRVSGMVDINSKDGNKKHLNAEASVGLLSASGLLEGPIFRKATFLLAGRRSWESPLFNNLLGSVYDASKVQQNGFLNQFNSSASLSASFYDLNTKLSYQLNPSNSVSISFYTGNDYTNNTSTSNLPVFGGVSVINADSIRWGNTGTSLQWLTRISKTVSINSVLAYSQYFGLRNNGLQTAFALQDGGTSTVKYGTREDNKLNESSLRSTITLRTEQKNTIDIGVAISSLSTDFRYRQNDTISILEQRNKGLFATIYVQSISSFFQKKTQITAGFRLPYYSPTQRFYPEPRLAIIHALNHSVKLKASSGIFNQFAKQVDRDDVSSRGFWVLSGPNAINPTSAWHGIVGLSFEKEGFLIDLEGYYKYLWNETRFSLTNVSQTLLNQTIEASFYTGTSHIKGIDLLIQKKIGRLTGWLGYSLTKAKKSIPDLFGYVFPANTDVRHELKATCLLSINRWSLSTSWLYATGRPYTAITGSYALSYPDGKSQYYTPTTDFNQMRYPPFHRLDLSASYRFKHGNLSCSLFNVYDHENIWYYKYVILNNVNKQKGVVESSLLISQINYLGFTPSLSVSLKLR